MLEVLVDHVLNWWNGAVVLVERDGLLEALVDVFNRNMSRLLWGSFTLA